MAVTKSELKKRAEELKKMAENCGLDQNFLFLTTFDRYQEVLKILDQLKKTIKQEGMIVEKEYVKGRKNLVISPAVKQYDVMCKTANQTAGTLMEIITKLQAKGLADAEDDEML